MRGIILIFILSSFISFGQSIVSTNPNSGNAGQTLNVTITGANTHFAQASGTSVYFGFEQGSSTVNSINAISNTSLVVNVTIPSNTFTGDYQVNTYNSTDGYLTLNNGFHVNGIPAPAISSVSPNSGNAGQTLNVSITGANTHFNQASSTGVSFSFNQGSSTVNSINVVSNTSLLVNVSIPANTFTGDYSVYVYNDVDGILSQLNGFHVNGIAAPEISSISPNNGLPGQTLNVTITGANTHFSQGSGTYLDFGFNQGSGTTVVNSLNIISDTQIDANITIPNNTLFSAYDVILNNSIDGLMYLSGGFLVGSSGLVKFRNENSFEIYPNPSKEFVFLKPNNSIQSSISGIEIFDYNGKLIRLEKNIPALNSIEIGDLKAGVYLIKINYSGLSEYHKIIKE